MGNPGMPMLTRLGYSTPWHSEGRISSKYQSFFIEQTIQTYLDRALLREILYPHIFSDLKYFSYLSAGSFFFLFATFRAIWSKLFTETIVVFEIPGVVREEETIPLHITHITTFTPNIYMVPGGYCIHVCYYQSSNQPKRVFQLWNSYVGTILGSWCVAFDKNIKVSYTQPKRRRRKKKIKKI